MTENGNYIVKIMQDNFEETNFYNNLNKAKQEIKEKLKSKWYQKPVYIYKLIEVIK